RRYLDRLGYGDAERAGGVFGLGPAGIGQVAGRAVRRGSPRLHHRPAVRLLVVTRPDHEDLALEPEQRTGEGERRPPLPGTGLGSQLADAGPGVLVRLRDRGVGLVRAGR